MTKEAEALDGAEVQYAAALKAVTAAIVTRFPGWASELGASVAASQPEVTNSKADRELRALKMEVIESAQGALRGVSESIWAAFDDSAYEMGRKDATLPGVRADMQRFLDSLAARLIDKFADAGYRFENPNGFGPGAIQPDPAFDETVRQLAYAADALRQAHQRRQVALGDEPILERWNRL